MEPSCASEGVSKDQKTAPLIGRFLTTEGVDPVDQIEWEIRDSVPGGDESKRVHNITVPKEWSQQALDIAVKLYLAKGDEYEEKSIRQLVHRVVNKIAVEGVLAGYFDDELDEDGGISGLDADNPARIFYDELMAICLNQLATFNSPVWFNIGRKDRPQCPSACFLLGVDDTSESIMEWARNEAFIFKAGAGSGVNASKLRGSSEKLSTGGESSGPISFMRVTNAVSETFKSGGTTRRAARMVQLDADHPDIEDFIACKPREEERLEILCKSGVNIGFDREGERNVAEVTSYQGANNSVRVTDEFMRAAENDAPWDLIERKTGKIAKEINANDLLDKISIAAHTCADPGIMFHDTINSWHTTPADGPIEESNPCGETHLTSNSSCNLASVNVLKFLNEDGTTDVEKLRHVVDIMTVAMDILVEFCELPTDLLTERTKKFRWLGLGFSNMGAAIMAQGFPYDSHEAREFARSFMALETGRCYRMSAKLAEKVGPFAGYEENREAMLEVMDRHKSFIPSETSKETIWRAAHDDWMDVIILGRRYGYRNAQATVIAPTGTTSFFMGCDTTGAEPMWNLITYKELAGGGSMVIVNSTVKRAASLLGGYSEENLLSMADGDFSSIAEEDQAIFHGANEISAEGHIRMIAAIQPFISGAASKTINLPSSATVEEIRECYELAWRLGVKCISVYRDGSKVRQVLSSKPKVEESTTEQYPLLQSKVDKGLITGSGLPTPNQRPLRTVDGPVRRRLPRTRSSLTHKIHVRGQLGDHEGYVTLGSYPDGTVGEMFLEGFGRLGGFTQNALSAWATSVSVGLQYGVPLEVLVRKFVGHSDETGGMVVPEKDGPPLLIRSCDSLIDYIARWIISQCGSVDLCEELGVMTDAVKERKMDLVDDNGSLQGISPTSRGSWEDTTSNPVEDARKMIATLSSNGNGHAKSVEMRADSCPSCKIPMQRTGSCWTCSQCGSTSGCG